MPNTQPDIVLLVGEDTGLHLGCYGNDYAHTPNLDRLAQQGTRYTNAFSTSPVCAPSRSCLITGQYPWSLGTHAMRSTLLNPPRLFSQELRDAGYYVNWANKTDFNFEPPQDFADECSDWTKQLADNQLPDKPRFLFMNFPITHESSLWINNPDVEEKERRLFGKIKDEWKHDPDKAPVPDYLPDTPLVRQNIANYFDALSAQDEQVGKVLEAIKQSGRAENTIVIYMTDHGRGLVREKRWCYDAGVHLPLIIRWPDHLEQGKMDDRLVSWVDMAPTILSLAGAKIPDTYQGAPFIHSDCNAQREYIFAGRDRMDEAFDRVRVARNKQYHYIRNDFPKLPYAQRNRYMEKSETTKELRKLGAQEKLTSAQKLWMQEQKPAEELYDAQEDPQMINNLAGDPDYKEVLTQMRTALNKHLEKVGDLGCEEERNLVERGLVKDRLEEYRSRIEPLPEEYQIGPKQTVLELHEAQEYCK